MFSILCFGDSIAYGRGEIPTKGWVGRLKDDFETELIHKGVYNLGIPGETSYSLRKRIRQETLPRIWRRKDSDKYLAIIEVGGNDAKEIIREGNSTTKPHEFKTYLLECIEQVEDIVDNIVLIGVGQVDEKRTRPFKNNVYFSNEFLREYNQIIKEVAQEKNCYFCNLQQFQLPKERITELLVDGVHPNKEGYDLLYDFIKDFLDNNNIIK